MQGGGVGGEGGGGGGGKMRILGFKIRSYQELGKS